MEDLQKATFEPLVNSTFQVCDASGTQTEFQLVEVSARDVDPKLEQFALLFRAAKSVSLEQGTYLIEHRALGKQSLFFVPVGRDEMGMLYEVVFCRLIK